MKAEMKLFSSGTRIRKHADFAYVREQGRNRAGRFCAVRAATPRESGWRVAIVVSRYFSRKAVERNRAKRVLREACRQVLSEFPETWLVIRPRQPIKRAGTQDVAEDLRAALKKLRDSKSRH